MKRRTRWLIVALSAATVAVAAYGIVRSRQTTFTSIAVMPFVGLSPETEPAWLCDGLTEEAIDALTRVPGLRVTGAASVFILRDQHPDPATVGSRLGVDSMLEASVQMLPDRVRIAAQLTSVPQGHRIWSKIVERPLDQSGFVAGDLARRVNSSGVAATAKRAPALQSYDAYLHGRYWMREGDPDSLARAVTWFERATEADPQFASAWAQLAIARTALVEHGVGRPNEKMPDSRDAAERAVAIDPEPGVTHAALGIVRLQYDWNWVEAKREFDRALERQPGSAPFRIWMARWFDAMGRQGEALALLRDCLHSDPLSPELRAEMDEVRGAALPAVTDESAAAAALDSAEARREEQYVDGLYCARLAIPVKDWDPALEWLEVACDERSPAVELIRLMRLVPRGPRVEALQVRMKLPEAASRSFTGR